MPNNKAKQPRKPKAPLGTWAQWQDTIPSEGQIKQWFSGTDNGVGLLTGFNGSHFIAGIDFDLKDFQSEAAMNAAIEQLFKAQPRLRNCQRDRSPNGGLHIYAAFARFEDFKSNNGFALAPNQTARVGELICGDAAKGGTGGHIILAPSQGYTWENWHDGYPEIFESPQAIGLFPLAEKTTTEVVKAAPKKIAPNPTTSVGVGKPAVKEKRYSSRADFLNRCLKPAYLQLPVEEQFTLDYCDPQLKQVSPTEWRGFNPFGDEQKNPEAFSVKLQADRMTVFNSFSTEQSGNVFQFICLKRYGKAKADGANFFDFMEVLSQCTGIAIPDYLDTDKQERDRAAALDEQLTPEQREVFEKYPHHTPGGVRKSFGQIVSEAVFSGDYICPTGLLYKYCGTHYEEIKDGVAIRLISAFADIYPVETISPRGVSSFNFSYAAPKPIADALNWVKARYSIDSALLNPSTGLNLQNGVLQLTYNVVTKQFDRALVPHTPKQFFTYVSAARYDASAATAEADRMMDCLDPASAAIVLKSIGASLVLPEVRKLKGSRTIKAAVLFGNGLNGKDTLMSVSSMLLGSSGVSSVGFADFKQYDNGRKFSVAPLSGARLNWSSENSKVLLDNIQSLKAAITGDRLECEVKNQQGEGFNPKAVFFFNTNHLPVIKSLKEAMSSRYAIIGFTKEYVDTPSKPSHMKADPRFKEDPEFVERELLPGFLLLVLNALDDLMLNGIDYSASNTALEQSKREHCHLVEFCDDIGLEYDPQSTEKIYPKDIYEKLKSWYVAEGWAKEDPYSEGDIKFLPTDDREYDTAIQQIKSVFARLRNDVFEGITQGKKDKRGVPICGLTWGTPRSDRSEPQDTESAEPTTSVGGTKAAATIEPPKVAKDTVAAIKAHCDDPKQLERIFVGLCDASESDQAETWKLLAGKAKPDRLEGFRAIAEKAKGIYTAQQLETQPQAQTTAEAPAIEYAQPSLVSSNPNML